MRRSTWVRSAGIARRRSARPTNSSASSIGVRVISAAGEIQRHAQVLGDCEAAERARQLEAAHESDAHALVRRQPVDAALREPNLAAVVAQGAAGAADEGALARAVRTDQADALARRHVQSDVIERDEAAESLV